MTCKLKMTFILLKSNAQTCPPASFLQVETCVLEPSPPHTSVCRCTFYSGTKGLPGSSSAVRSGLSSAVNHCLNLSGTCRRNNCKPTEDILGSCKRRWKCCRQWWIMLPIPTPVVYSEYQDPLKNKIK
nr:beta-defensin 109-like [Vicugna pacos]